jgi:hypothetical protein
MGRVFEASLGDLKANAEDDAFRKFKLRVEEVQGTNCLTNFYGQRTQSTKPKPTWACRVLEDVKPGHFVHRCLRAPAAASPSSSSQSVPI